MSGQQPTNEPRLTVEQIQHAFRAVTGIVPRTADVQMVEHMGGTPSELAEYIWDHIMGEPEEVTSEQLAEAIRRAVA